MQVRRQSSDVILTKLMFCDLVRRFVTCGNHMKVPINVGKGPALNGQERQRQLCVCRPVLSSFLNYMLDLFRANQECRAPCLYLESVYTSVL